MVAVRPSRNTVLRAGRDRRRINPARRLPRQRPRAVRQRRARRRLRPAGPGHLVGELRRADRRRSSGGRRGRRRHLVHNPRHQQRHPHHQQRRARRQPLPADGRLGLDGARRPLRRGAGCRR